MKIPIFILCFLCVFSCVFSQSTSSEDFDIHCHCSRDKALHLCNERAINYFLSGSLDLALVDFDYVLSQIDPQSKEDRQFMATALWGRMLCHAFSDSLDKTEEDIQLIRHFFIAPKNCDKASPRKSISALDNQYSDQNAQLTPKECRERVYGTANSARAFAMKIRDVKIQWLVNQVISELEQLGYKCCEDAPDWTRCLDPIVNVWKKIKTSWDKFREMVDQGVSLAPYLVGPS